MNDLGLALLKSFESCRLQAYPDPATGAEPFTVGFGATGEGIDSNTVWAQEQADADLSQRLVTICDKVTNIVVASLSSNQLSALIDFAYNLGLGALEGSTLLRKVNAGDFPGATDQFALWTHAAGKTLPGLVTRRRAEACLFAGDEAGVWAILAAR